MALGYFWGRAEYDSYSAVGFASLKAVPADDREERGPLLGMLGPPDEASDDDELR